MQIRLRRWREEDGRDFDRFACHEAIWRYMHADFPRTPAQCEAAVRALVHADPRRMFVRAIEIEGHEKTVHGRTRRTGWQSAIGIAA